MRVGLVQWAITQVVIGTFQKLKECLFITQKFCNVYRIPSLTELSKIEADDQEEEVPQATPAEDAPRETQSKNKRKRKAQNKKQLGGK